MKTITPINVWYNGGMVEANQYACDWIASKLNITITGEYIMPFSPFPPNYNR